MVMVSIEMRPFTRQGYGAPSQECDYTVVLCDFQDKKVSLRRYSTHGNMHEGYWGSSARKMAREHARRVANILGQKQFVFWKAKPNKTENCNG